MTAQQHEDRIIQEIRELGKGAVSAARLDPSGTPEARQRNEQALSKAFTALILEGRGKELATQMGTITWLGIKSRGLGGGAATIAAEQAMGRMYAAIMEGVNEQVELQYPGRDWDQLGISAKEVRRMLTKGRDGWSGGAGHARTKRKKRPGKRK